MRKSKISSNFEVLQWLWEAELLDSLILISVVPWISVVVEVFDMVAEITELWLENSQKINWRDVTYIRERRVIWVTW